MTSIKKSRLKKLTISEKINKISSFQNLQQYIITNNNGLCNFPSSQNRGKNRENFYNITYTSSEHSTSSYIYDKLKQNIDSNTTFVIPPRFDDYIQTERNSYSDATAGENDVASGGFYQSINHHSNTYGKDNDDSQSFETPMKNNCSYSSFGDTISTTTTPHISILPQPGKNIYIAPKKISRDVGNGKGLAVIDINSGLL